MVRRNFVRFALTVLVSLSMVSVASAADLWTQGHGDIGIAYEGGAWDLHIHVEGATVGGTVYPDQEFEPDEVDIEVPNTDTRAAGSQWDPIGVGDGASFYLSPQNEVVGTPYVGLATEEIDPGVFVGDEITLSLMGVSGPGDFSMYSVDGFGTPTFYMSTADAGADDATLSVGSHTHYNLGFTAAGTYEVTFEGSGTLDDGNSTFTSGQATYTFVVPEPTSLLLLLPGVALLRRRNFSN